MISLPEIDMGYPSDYPNHKTELDRMKEAVRSLIESYDILVGERSPFRGNEIALGVIRGMFQGIDEARELITEGPRGEG